MHALVIDDARTTRMILRQILQNLGFDVTEAGNGREGLEQLRRLDQVDVVLVDCHMPEMDGFAFLQAVRADSAFSRLQVIMVAGAEESGLAARSVEAGANAYIAKPFKKELIQEKIACLRP
ncbi:MAG TPA: response regulator [Gemmataceae bacterium]|jgi:two-component system chemotaxis response regulator CheY|nr:response regulator [Gemmataceae bacterium]